jgi:hypothetical protein
MIQVHSTTLSLLLICGSAAAQDIPALIEKLKGPETSQGASTELLKVGEGAIAPLRAGASASEDTAFKKRASAVADQLETRQAAAGLGGPGAIAGTLCSSTT